MAQTLKDKRTKTVSAALLKHVLLQFIPPSCICSDQEKASEITVNAQELTTTPDNQVEVLRIYSEFLLDTWFPITSYRNQLGYFQILFCIPLRWLLSTLMFALFFLSINVCTSSKSIDFYKQVLQKSPCCLLPRGCDHYIRSLQNLPAHSVTAIFYVALMSRQTGSFLDRTWILLLLREILLGLTCWYTDGAVIGSCILLFSSWELHREESVRLPAPLLWFPIDWFFAKVQYTGLYFWWTQLNHRIIEG